MSQSRGIARTQVSGGSAGASGSLALIGSTLIAHGTSFGAASLSVNLSTEGTYDWLLFFATSATESQLSSDPVIFRWKKTRGTMLLKLRVFLYQTDTSFNFLGQGPIQYSANAGDDAGAGSGDSTTFPITNVRTPLEGVFLNSSTREPLGYGWQISIPLAAGQLRTINVYCGLRCTFQHAATALFTAHLMDGSAGDVSTVLNATDVAFNQGAQYYVYKVTLQTKPANSTELVISLALASTTMPPAAGNGEAVVFSAVTIS